MTPELERLAREAGLRITHTGLVMPSINDNLTGETTEAIERFAMLVAQAENERCAKLADDLLAKLPGGIPGAIRSSAPGQAQG